MDKARIAWAWTEFERDTPPPPSESTVARVFFLVEADGNQSWTETGYRSGGDGDTIETLSGTNCC